MPTLGCRPRPGLARLPYIIMSNCASHCSFSQYTRGTAVHGCLGRRHSSSFAFQVARLTCLSFFDSAPTLLVASDILSTLIYIIDGHVQVSAGRRPAPRELGAGRAPIQRHRLVVGCRHGAQRSRVQEPGRHRGAARGDSGRERDQHLAAARGESDVPCSISVADGLYSG